MSHVITMLCMGDGACMKVCPVECIVRGKPETQWPWSYIDPGNCTDCGLCVEACPHEAIFLEGAVPSLYGLHAGQWIADTKANMPDGRPHDSNVAGHIVRVANAMEPGAGAAVDLSAAIELNSAFFSEGPGYKAKG